MKTKKPKKLTVKDLIGKPLQRDDAYMMRVFDRALVEDIKKDVVVEFGDYYDLQRSYPSYYGYGQKPGVTLPDTKNYSKVRAYCRAVNSYLQFPRAIRKPGDRYVCDIVSTENDKVGGFWRYIQGTVRKEGSDKVVA